MLRLCPLAHRRRHTAESRLRQFHENKLSLCWHASVRACLARLFLMELCWEKMCFAQVSLVELRWMQMCSARIKAYGCGDFMRASGELAQHARRISVVLRLAQDFAIDHDDCVCAQNVALRIMRCYCFRFFPRQTQSVCDRRLAGALVFIDVGRMHLKRNSDFAQEFLTPRRRRS